MELMTTTKSTSTTMMMMFMMVMVTTMFGVGGGSTPEPQCNQELVVPPTEDLLQYSDVVVLGEVKSKTTEPVAPARKEQDEAEEGDNGAQDQDQDQDQAEDEEDEAMRRPAMYRVRMLVYCVYKGQQVPRTIDIWEAGNINEDCPEQEMQEGGMYLASLYKHSPTVHTPAFPHLPDTYKDELYVVCDLNISTPLGDLPAGSKDVTCADKQQDYEYYRDYDNNPNGDFFGEQEQENCIRLTAKSGDSTYRIKKPSNLYIPKSEKVEGGEKVVEDGGEGGAGGLSVCLALLSSALLAAAATAVIPPLSL